MAKKTPKTIPTPSIHMVKNTLKFTRTWNNFPTKIKKMLHNQKKITLIKHLMIFHFQNKHWQISCPLKNTLKQRKIMCKLRHLKSGTIPTQFHCSICWLHIIIFLFGIWQIIWQQMKIKTDKNISFKSDIC